MNINTTSRIRSDVPPPLFGLYAACITPARQVENALLPPDSEGHARADEGLDTLFAHNAYGILWHMADEAAATVNGTRPCDDAPAVTREIISIALDADKGPLVETPAPQPDTAGVSVSVTGTDTLPRVEPQAAGAPASSRYPEASYPATAQHPIDSEQHPSAPQSPAKFGGGGAVRDDFDDEDAYSETRSFLWHLWRHAESYGLTRQPLTASCRLMMSGTVTARRTAALKPAAASAGYRDVGRAGVLEGARINADPDGDAAKEFRVCTFVLTTPDDDERVPGNERKGSAGARESTQVGGLEERTIDVMLLVIAGARSRLSRSRGGSATSRARCSAVESAGLVGCGGGDRAFDLLEAGSCGPDAVEVFEQAKVLVERQLRLAMAHLRRDRVWSVFNEAMAILAAREEAPNPLHTPRPSAVAQASGHPDLYLRAPSPASSHAGIDGRFARGAGGIRCTSLLGLNDYASSVCEADLRHLLEVSVVTPLDVADPNLRGLLDVKYGVDWPAWFQHLVDSPTMQTIFFEEGDAALLDSGASTSSGMAAAAAAETGGDGPKGANSGNTDAVGASARRSRRCVLLVLPRTVVPGSAGDVGTFHGRGGNGAESVEEEGSGEGPWVGSSGAASTAAATLEPPCLFFCVALDKVGTIYSGRSESRGAVLVASPSC